ncbi:Death-associated protein kinase 1 [Nymphon striatum]|nr:Death-associated protein kinase 1 [Nymphon striatum]
MDYIVGEPEDENNVVINALFGSIESANISGVQQVLSNKIDPDMTNKHGESAVHIAAGVGHLDILKFLQSKGADINLLDNNGDSTICWAARQGHSHIIKYLVSEDVSVHTRNKADETALHIAARYGHSDAIQTLCAVGCDVNAYDEHGETSLHIAVWHGFPKIVYVLCQHGANVNLRDKEEESPLHCAANRGHAESVKCLLDSRAIVDLQNKRGSAPLHLTIKRHHNQVAMLLLNAGCNIDITDKHGEAPIHLVAREGLLQLAQTLCAFGCKVDIPNHAGLYPLHLASKNGHTEVVRCLCLAGATVDQKNKDGIPSEITALAQGFNDIGNLLNRLRNDQAKEAYILQLIPSTQPIPRVKVKLFGHSGVGKTTIADTLKCGYLTAPHLATIELNSSAVTKNKVPLSFDTGFDNYTRGIDVQQLNLFTSTGDFSLWEFSGQESYFLLYDQFIGNTSCIHTVVFNLTDPYQVQLQQVIFWLQFLQARIPPSFPLGYGGKSSKPGKLVLVAAHADSARCTRNVTTGEYVSSEANAILKYVLDKYGSIFDVHENVFVVDAHVVGSPSMKAFKQYLADTKAKLVQCLPKTTGFLDNVLLYLPTWRKNSLSFPVSSWQQFIETIHINVNPLAGEEHMKELIQQLQLMGEVLYLKSDNEDLVVFNPRWLCNEVLGHLLSHEHLDRARVTGCYSVDDIQLLFPDTDALDLLQVLESVNLCTQCDNDGDIEYEFPCFNHVETLPGLWDKSEEHYADAVYGGILLRKAAIENHDPDNDLYQWYHGSKMCSSSLEGIITSEEMGEAVEIKVRGPKNLSNECYYFLEDLICVVEQILNDTTPGLMVERHVLSSHQLSEHSSKIISFSPYDILSSQLQLKDDESQRNLNNNCEESLLELICFNSKHIKKNLTLGYDLHVSHLNDLAKQRLSAILDPTDAMGRDWCMLAVRLGMTDKLPRLDTGNNPSVSHTCRIINEWSKSSSSCTIKSLINILEELSRNDAVKIILEGTPICKLLPKENITVNEEDCGDQQVDGAISHTSSSNLSR